MDHPGEIIAKVACAVWFVLLVFIIVGAVAR